MRRVILATGSREFDDQEVIDRTLSFVKPDLIIHGSARGADRMVQYWADRSGVETIPRPVTQYYYDTFGRGRGPNVRNQEMVYELSWYRAEGEDTAVVAFPLPGQLTGGTINTIDMALEAGHVVLQAI